MPVQPRLAVETILKAWKTDTRRVVLLVLLFMASYQYYFSTGPTTTHTATPDEMLQVYELVPGIHNRPPEFLEQVDIRSGTKLRPVKGGYQPIDKVHRQGSYHTGAMILVTDVTGNYILLLKRGPQLVTCPNTWGLMGEHTMRNEEELKTVQRGLVEELWQKQDTATSQNKLLESKVAFLQNLTEHPVFYYREYPNQRIDRQLTYLYEARLRYSHTDINNIAFQLDEEVADHQWITLEEFEQKLQAPDAEQVFCHTSMIHLDQLSLKHVKRLRENEKKSPRQQ